MKTKQKVTPISNIEQNQQVENTPEIDEEIVKTASEETINFFNSKVLGFYIWC